MGLRRGIQSTSVQGLAAEGGEKPEKKLEMLEGGLRKEEVAVGLGLAVVLSSEDATATPAPAAAVSVVREAAARR